MMISNVETLYSLITVALASSLNNCGAFGQGVEITRAIGYVAQNQHVLQ
jgi:hypothetical protein